MLQTNFRRVFCLCVCVVFSIVFASATLFCADMPVTSPQEEDVFSRGVQAYSAGDYTGAEKLLSTYLKNNPKSMIRDIGLLWYGRTLIALNRWDDARKVAESMDKEFPKSPLTRKLHDELDTSAKGKKTVQPQVAGAAKATKEKAKAAETKPPGAKPEMASKEPAKKPIATAPKGQAAEVHKEAAKTPVAAKPTAGTPKAPETKQKTTAAQPVTKPPAKPAEMTAKSQMPPKTAVSPTKKEEKPKPAAVAQSQKPLPVSGAQKAKESQAAASKEVSKTPAAHKVEGKPGATSVARAEKAKGLKPAKAPAKAVEKKKEIAGKTEQKIEEPEEKTYGFQSHRDPFRPLVVRASDEPPANLPPGKKGLLVNRLQLKGIVKTGSGYYAVVQSAANPAAIFLREKDVLHDGEVDKIYDDRVVFKRFSTDQMGKPIQEDVTRKLPLGGGI